MTVQTPRIDYKAFREIASAARDGLVAADKAVADSGLPKDLIELVKLRASHINGCAFCVHMHINDARKLGMASDKLDLVNVWREATNYTPRERAVLGWTDAMTQVSQSRGAGEEYAELARHFTSGEIAHLTVAIGVINSWNRIAVGLQFSTPVSPAAQKAA